MRAAVQTPRAGRAWVTGFMAADLAFALGSICAAALGCACGSGVALATLYGAMAASSFALYGRLYGTLLSSKGLLSLAWFGSIALACLQIHPSQVEWSPLMWLCVAIAYPCFILGHGIVVSRHGKGSKLAYEAADKYGYRALRPVLVVFGLVIIAAFLLECVYSGQVPLFSSSMSAYKDFGISYVHYLTISSGIYPALAYVCCVVSGLHLRDDRFLLALVLANALIPVLIVSGQLVVMEIFCSFAAWCVMGGGEARITLPRFFLAAAGMLAAYVVYAALFRHQSAAFLALTLNLPGSPDEFEAAMWRLYLYIAFNFGNMNYLIAHLGSYSFGANFFYPILVFTAAKGLMPDAVTGSEGLRALSEYTTYPFICDGYRDFGVVGVALSMFAVGLLVGYVELRAREGRDPFMDVMYCLVLYSVCICFFVNEFAQPVIWVYAALLACMSVACRPLASRSAGPGPGAGRRGRVQ